MDSQFFPLLVSEVGLHANSSAFAEELDRRDELRSFRDQFLIPPHPQTNPHDCIYLCGNSLGLQPKSAKLYLEEELQNWSQRAVLAHVSHSKNRPWVTTDDNVTPQIAELVGAQPTEVVVMNSLSVNLHLMMVSFYNPSPNRHKILIEAGAFPSDLYIATSQIEFHGYRVEDSLIFASPRDGEHLIRSEDIDAILREHGSSIALVLLPGVQYYTGQLLDVRHITQVAHQYGCIVGFDLAHAIGNVELFLHDWEVDFACWCTYKYLNSGPGNIAGAFIHAKHCVPTPDNSSLPIKRFAGWWGHDLATRFSMRDPQFVPTVGAQAWRLSNPPVICVATLLASVEIFMKATMKRIRQKSLLLTGYLEYLLKDVGLVVGTDTGVKPNLEQARTSIQIITPSNPSCRGAQLSLLFSDDVHKIYEYLKAHGVICDIRKPNVLRVAPAPLYNSFADVYNFVRLLQQAITEAPTFVLPKDDEGGLHH